MQTNPLLRKQDLPAFDEIKAQHVAEAVSTKSVARCSRSSVFWSEQRHCSVREEHGIGPSYNEIHPRGL